MTVAQQIRAKLDVALGEEMTSVVMARTATHVARFPNVTVEDHLNKFDPDRSVGNILLGMFTWGNTPEGHEYWWKIAQDNHEMEITL